MRKFILLLLTILVTATSQCFAAQLPNNVKAFVSKDFTKTNFRFDGVILLPDNTEYLPLIPAKMLTPETLKTKKTYPDGKTMADKPNVIILNNDYVLLKVLTDRN